MGASTHSPFWWSQRLAAPSQLNGSHECASIWLIFSSFFPKLCTSPSPSLPDIFDRFLTFTYFVPSHRSIDPSFCCQRANVRRHNFAMWHSPNAHLTFDHGTNGWPGSGTYSAIVDTIFSERQIPFETKIKYSFFTIYHLCVGVRCVRVFRFEPQTETRIYAPCVRCVVHPASTHNYKISVGCLVSVWCVRERAFARRIAHCGEKLNTRTANTWAVKRRVKRVWDNSAATVAAAMSILHIHNEERTWDMSRPKIMFLTARCERATSSNENHTHSCGRHTYRCAFWKRCDDKPPNWRRHERKKSNSEYPMLYRVYWLSTRDTRCSGEQQFSCWSTKNDEKKNNKFGGQRDWLSRFLCLSSVPLRMRIHQGTSATVATTLTHNDDAQRKLERTVNQVKPTAHAAYLWFQKWFIPIRCWKSKKETKNRRINDSDSTWLLRFRVTRVTPNASGNEMRAESSQRPHPIIYCARRQHSPETLLL